MYKVPINIREQLNSVPQSPGVYAMKDALGKIIYVGKAKKLKNRLSSYFRGVDTHPVKTKALVVNTKEFEYILTNSEEEALFLEANLIKTHQPKFNVLLKDDKSYPYVLLTQEEYPRLFKVRRLDPRGTCFGPFTGDFDVNKVLEALHSVYPIRKCHLPLNRITKPCLYYHMDMCLAPCAFRDVKEDYDIAVESIRDFFKDNRQPLIDILEKKRDEAAERLDFEGAIIIREQVEAAKRLSFHQQLSQLRADDVDYISFSEKEERVCITLFVRRDGKIIDRENHIFDNLLEKDRSETLQEFILQYYQEAAFIPGEIVVEALSEVALLKDYLKKVSGHGVEITIPKRGEKKKMLELVKRNSSEFLYKFSEKIDRDKDEKDEVDLILSTIFSKEIHRLEAYDISHLSGTFTVGSMVVYENGKKKPSDYRRFRIGHEEGVNDVASMQEMLRRRLKRLHEEGFGKVPDLILIDGGIQQVRAVQSVLEEMELDIQISGMVKDDRHRTHGLFVDEQTLPLDKTTAIYRFIYKIQEEVHRYALSYHHKLRGKGLEASVLTEIPGVGEKRKKALLTHFQSLEKIKKAELEELREVSGIDTKTAEEIYAFFR
ncbi:MAG: excinuclease ABC subunit UvrC [Tissierellia bacterium]|nr:excinuclease ABC subunit UvrC [Tissierellia bacterium]